MREYFTEVLERNSCMFTKEENEFIYNNLALIIKIFRLEKIDKFNISEGSF